MRMLNLIRLQCSRPNSSVTSPSVCQLVATTTDWLYETLCLSFVGDWFIMQMTIKRPINIRIVADTHRQSTLWLQSLSAFNVQTLNHSIDTAALDSQFTACFHWPFPSSIFSSCLGNFLQDQDQFNVSYSFLFYLNCKLKNNVKGNVRFTSYGNRLNCDSIHLLFKWCQITSIYWFTGVWTKEHSKWKE